MIETPDKPAPFDFSLLLKRGITLRAEMAWIVIGQAAAASGGIIGVKLLTHRLNPEIYGQLALGLTLMSLIQLTLLSPISGAALRFYSASRESGELEQFIAAQKRIFLYATLAIGLLSTCAALILRLTALQVWIPIMGCCSIFALLSSINDTLDGMQNAARQRRIVALHDGIGVWARFLLGAAFVSFFGATASNALYGYCVASLVVCLSQSYFFRRDLIPKQGPPIDEVLVKKWTMAIFGYAWPFASWGIFVWAQSASQRWSLHTFADTAQVGQFAVLFQLGYAPIMLLSGMAMQLVSPFLFRIAGDGRNPDNVKRCRRITIMFALAVLALTIFGCVISGAAADPVFAWIAPPAYRGAARYLPTMVLAAGLFSAGQFLSLGIMSETSTVPLILPKILTAVIAVALNFLGAFYAGLNGVVVAGALFSALYAIWMAALTSDRVKIFLGRARNGISNRLRDAYRILILKDEIAIAQRDWFKQRADFTLRLDYPLGPSSVVLDLGGYQGDWAAEISKRYDPVIHIFEPIESFAEGIRSRFQGNEKVFAHSFGLAAENTHTEICVSRDASSTFVSQGSTKNAIELRDIAAVLKALNVDRVDLIKINIEGGEYSVLRRLIDAGLISRCNNIQVQFHEFVKDAKALRLAIRSDLSRTHDLTYDFPFVWENWRLRDR